MCTSNTTHETSHSPTGSVDAMRTPKQSIRRHNYTIKVAVLTFFDFESVISHYIATYGTHPS